jgi:predicted SprT family Zn-dependent metalloprotease
MRTHSITFEKEDLELLADYFFELFLPRFAGQSEGSLREGTIIEFSRKMKNKVGLAVLFENKIRLSLSYFASNPQFLPYTIFHEMTHLWLYHSGFDPGHTRRFYKKMIEFEQTGYQIDPEVHIHTRLAAEGSYVYICNNCENRWHLREELDHHIYCALCYRKDGVEHYATLRHNAPEETLEMVYKTTDLAPFRKIDECA